MASPRISVGILGDQLLMDHPALAAALEQTAAENITVVLVESTAKLRMYPWQRKKLVLLLSAMRHYAQWLEEQGYRVDYRQADTFMAGLRRHVRDHTPDRVLTMAASHYAGRTMQTGRLSAQLGMPVEVLPNSQFLVEQFNPYPEPEPGKRYVMEHFYREMRRHFDVLLEPDGEPVGGQWNFDKQNRKPLPNDLDPPTPARYDADEITQQVMDEVAAMPNGIGTVAGFNLAVTHQQAASALGNFMALRMEQFGPYEDAMSARHATLFHSVLSPYVNLGLLEPMQMVRAAERAHHAGRAPINSVEGFVRQVLGWREFMYWQYWRQMPGMGEQNAWDAQRPLPEFFWDGDTDMNCLRHAVRRALDMGYTHHIERLMLLCNFCMMAGVNPAAVNDWFMACFIDAYDWVMPPNVIGMGLNADGGLTATKPYISSANYINKMGDYCQGCRYHHKQRTGEDACPFNFLYWNFLIKYEERLRANPRLGRNVLGLRHLDAEEREAVQEQARAFLAGLNSEK